MFSFFKKSVELSCKSKVSQNKIKIIALLRSKKMSSKDFFTTFTQSEKKKIITKCPKWIPKYH